MMMFVGVGCRLLDAANKLVQSKLEQLVLDPFTAFVLDR